jgi:hypothetical protein
VEVSEAVAYLLLALGTLLSILTGRGLAARSHDIRLAREKALRMSAGGLIYYFYGVLAFIANFFFLFFSKLAGFGVETLWRMDIVPAIADILYSAAVIMTSYYFFSFKFRRSSEYLTLEGKLTEKMLERLKLAPGEKNRCEKKECKEDGKGS